MTDAFGHDLSDVEQELVAAFDALERLVRERADELAPYQLRNALKALAALWQVVNGLDLDPPQLYDLGA